MKRTPQPMVTALLLGLALELVCVALFVWPGWFSAWPPIGAWIGELPPLAAALFVPILIVICAIWLAGDDEQEGTSGPSRGSETAGEPRNDGTPDEPS